MESLFQQTDVELQRVHFSFRQLEQCANESQAQPIFQTIAQQMQKLGQDLENLNRMVSKEPPVRRRTSRFRYEQIHLDYNTLNSSIAHLQTKLTTKWRSTADREELLTRRFTPNETHLDLEVFDFVIKLETDPCDVLGH
jgi:hypothetical protein